MYNVYKTINLINGNFYWGVHNSIDENDGYFGSGEVLLKAIAKHGRSNFRRITKLLYDNAEDAYADEARIVNSEMVKRKDCYNMREGGRGGSLPGEDNWNYGKPKSEEHKRKISVSNSITCSDGRRKGENNSMFGRTGNKSPHFGKHYSDETKRKISIARKEFLKKNPIVVSEQTKKKISERTKGQNNPMSKMNRDLRAAKEAETC